MRRMVILAMEFSAAAGIVLTALWLAQAEELLAARGGHAHRFIGRIVIDGGAVDSPAWRIGHAGRLFQHKACGASRWPEESDVPAGAKNGERRPENRPGGVGGNLAARDGE